jgi:hypothetical protein
MDNTLGNALMIEPVDLSIELVFVIPE